MKRERHNWKTWGEKCNPDFFCVQCNNEPLGTRICRQTELHFTTNHRPEICREMCKCHVVCSVLLFRAVLWAFVHSGCTRQQWCSQCSFVSPSCWCHLHKHRATTEILLCTLSCANSHYSPCNLAVWTEPVPHLWTMRAELKFQSQAEILQWSSTTWCVDFCTAPMCCQQDSQKWLNLNHWAHNPWKFAVLAMKRSV